MFKNIFNYINLYLYESIFRSNKMEKVFALVDCNSFYASCEKVFNPKLEGKAVVVLSNNDGCIIARSKEAKEAGIKMGEPAFKIKHKLEKNNVHVFSANFALYGDMSQRVMNVLSKFTPNLEIYSIDEAFLDISGMNISEYELYAHKIKDSVLQWTGIPVSIGIARTKTIAKIANHIVKESESNNGVLALLDMNNIEKVLEITPVENVWGVGRQYCSFLRDHGITNALALANANDNWIKKHLKITGLRTVEELRGKPCIAFDMTVADKQTICTSRSFGKPMTDYNDIEEAVTTFAARCAEKLRSQNSCAGVLTVFVMTNLFAKDPKYVNGKTMQLPVATNNTAEIIIHVVMLLKALFRKGYKYKKAGVILTGFISESEVQHSLWDNIDRKKQTELINVIDKITSTMGSHVVKYAIQGSRRRWKLRQEKLSPAYTTKWDKILRIDMDKG
jgi:DNA polymerase V